MSIKDRGFASMSRDRRREIASLGGRAAQVAGTAHRWTSAEASEAGRKGGRAGKGLLKDNGGSIIDAAFTEGEFIGEVSNETINTERGL